MEENGKKWTKIERNRVIVYSPKKCQKKQTVTSKTKTKTHNIQYSIFNIRYSIFSKKKNKKKLKLDRK